VWRYEADSGDGRVLRLTLRHTDEDALRRNLRQSVRHHSHVHFPPLLAGVINRNPRDDEGREQEQRNGALSPTLRAGGNVALIAWIWVGHSVLMLCVPNLDFRPSVGSALARAAFVEIGEAIRARIAAPARVPELAIEQALREDARIPRP